MILNKILETNYKYKYVNDDFTIFSNIPENELKLPKVTPIFTSCLDDDLLLKKLFSNEFILKFIWNNLSIKAIYLVGSKVFGLDDQYSDYDLCVITDDINEDGRNNCYIQYKDEIKIHWYYIPLSDFIQNNYLNTFTNYALLQLNGYNQLAQNKLIYADADDTVVIINQNIQAIASYATKLFCERLMPDLIKNTLILGKINVKTKLYYYLCIIAHIISDTKFNYIYLIELKRIKIKDISADCEKYCLQQLQFLQNYFVKNKEGC